MVAQQRLNNRTLYLDFAACNLHSSNQPANCNKWILYRVLPKVIAVLFRLVEIGSNEEIGIRSVDAKITQTTNPIVNMTKTIGLWLMLF